MISLKMSKISSFLSPKKNIFLFKQGSLKKPIHVGTAVSRSVLLTVGAISDLLRAKQWFPPPEHKPNMNENRNESKGPVHSVRHRRLPM